MDDVFVCTFTNAGYMPFIRNFMENLARLKVPWVFHILCIDEASRDECAARGWAHIHCPIDAATHELTVYGKDTFIQLCFNKLDALRYVMKTYTGRYIIYMDTDIHLYRDPVPYIYEQFKHTNSIFVAQCDEHYIEHIIDCNCKKIPFPRICAGFMAFLNIPCVYDLFDYATILKKYNVNPLAFATGDQMYLNEIMKRHNIEFSTLDRLKFINGDFLKEDMLFRLLEEDAYILHYNYMPGSIKIDTMKRLGHWYIEERDASPGSASA